jgi:hypothetical protein
VSVDRKDLLGDAAADRSGRVCAEVLTGRGVVDRRVGGGASAWSSAPVASGDEIVAAVSCPSISLCVATTNKGDVFTSTYPAGGASTWKKTTVDQGAFLTAVSCPSVSLCIAADRGNILTSTDPTVALDSLVLNWNHDGAQRQLQLR